MSHSLSKWKTFAQERFDPGSHLLMILVFFLAHRSLYPEMPLPVGKFIALFVGITAFFFKLRLYDEIKDYELDVKINPRRPLARGLVVHRDLYQGIVVCIGIELMTFTVCGMGALAGMAIAILYSLLMYKEFFIREKIRPHLTTYAVSHTVVSGFLTIAILCALMDRMPWDLDRSAYFFALNSWCLFNIFEFGRKTFLSSEERPGVESYSKIFGRFGAVALVLVMAGASAYLLAQMRQAEQTPAITAFVSASAGALAIVGIAYAALNRPPLGQVYRAFSSIYIVLIYTGLIAAHYSLK